MYTHAPQNIFARLRLRPYVSSDAAHIVSWCRSEFAFRQWCADFFDHYPLLPMEFESYARALDNNPRSFVMTGCLGQTVIGSVSLRYPRDTDDTVRLGFVILDPAYRGLGLGKKLVQAAARYAFDYLDARRVTLGVFENNPSAHHCYLQAGFRPNAKEPVFYCAIMGEEWTQYELECMRPTDPAADTL
ncbi:MAG: GNAT family N-acetyltransferase [Clostridia bacterium]|nr:GNAT family N-acetyltransferase [Clostridia bacterium]